jgi:Holliday junction resolvasome RuvABC ATP-dependent DNA helicase subunit
MKPPLQSRLTPVRISPYSTDEMIRIISSEISLDNLEPIVYCSRYNPRVALTQARLCQANGNIKETLKKLGFELAHYLTKIDYSYLELLAQRGPMGIRAIATLLDENEFTIRYNLEPFMLKSELIELTKKGRAITELGKKIVEEGNPF